MNKDNLIYKGLYDIKKQMNSLFQYIESPIVDSIRNNFHFLLMDNHPSISEDETFYLDSNLILRTHATNFQSIVFSKYYKEINQIYNLDGVSRYYSVGRVFRKDDSSRHSYFFHQCDGLIIGKNITFESATEELKNIICNFLKINAEIKIRRSYFPFTYVSSEMDIKINNKYLEVMGFGMTHPEILKNCNLSNISCFAFGFGLERLVSIRENYDSIKELIKS